MKFDTVITAENDGRINIRELLQYRYLIWLFIKRDFISKYKQTILGPLWAVIQPLMTTLVFNVLFGTLARLTTMDSAEQAQVPGFLFYMSGTICWSYFSQTVKNTANTLLINRRILGKVYFPRLVTPVSSALANLISFGIRFVMFLGFWAYFLLRGDTGIHLNAYIWLLPALILQLILTGLGFGLIVASATIKYRDMIHMLDFTLELWHYGTPVAYGLSLIPAKYLGLYLLNPLSMIIVTFRNAFFGSGYFHTGYYAMGWAVTLLFLMAGLKLFCKVERTFVDTI